MRAPSKIFILLPFVLFEAGCASGRTDSVTSISQIVDAGLPDLEDRANATVTYDQRWDIYRKIGPEIIAVYRDFAESINPQTGVGNISRRTLGKYSGFAEGRGAASISGANDSLFYNFTIALTSYSNTGAVLLDGEISCNSRAFSSGKGEGGTTTVLIGSGAWRTDWVLVDGPVRFHGDFRGTMTFLQLRVAVDSLLNMVDPKKPEDRPSYFYDSSKVTVESGGGSFAYAPYYD